MPYLQELPQTERFTPVTKVMDPLARHVLSLGDDYFTAREILGQVAVLSNQAVRWRRTTSKEPSPVDGGLHPPVDDRSTTVPRAGE